MKVPALLAVLLLLTATASAFLPPSASIGYPYTFNASLGTSFKNTPCLLSAYDKFGTNAKSWLTDYPGFPLSTDNGGYLHSFIVPDNSFALGENYTFILKCGSSTEAQLVSFEVGGSSVTNIFLFNAFEWANARSDETVLLAILALVALAVLAFAYRSVVRRGKVF